MRHSGPWSASRLSFVFIAAVGAGGCPVINNNHCALNQGACGDGLVCSMCAADNNGCVALETINDNGCMFGGGTTEGPTNGFTTTTGPTTTEAPDTTTPTSFPTTLDETTVDVTVTASSSTTDEPSTVTMTTMPDPDTSSTATTTSEDECDPNFGNDDCVQPEPYCFEEKCVSCVDVPCSTVDPDKPACNAQFGTCVECVTNADCPDLKVCDPDSATCKACTTHEQCGEEFGGPGTACNLDDGTCFSPDNVLWVQNTPGAPVSCKNDNPGTEEQPICLLSYALAKATPETPLTIKVRQGSMPQNENNIVKPSVDVAIVSADDSNVSLIRNGAEPALEVSDNARVYVNRISMSSQPAGTAAILVGCNAGTLWLDRANISQGDTGIDVVGCNLHLRRSAVFENITTGGVDLDNSKLFMENSFITRNGPIFGLRVSNGSTADINYSTFALNTGAMIAPIVCVTSPNKPLKLRNTLINSINEKFFTCATTDDSEHMTTVYTIEADTVTELINGDVAAAFTNGILRAKKDGVLATKAIWKDGDPHDDYDTNDVRPAGPENADYAGADVP